VANTSSRALLGPAFFLADFLADFLAELLHRVVIRRRRLTLKLLAIIIFK
jgi:hypothetical protein